MKRIYTVLLACLLVNEIPAQTPITSDNIGSYAPSLTGAGASGTWGINITGNAAQSILWNGTLYEGTALTGTPAWIMAYDGTGVGKWKPSSPEAIRSFLGIPVSGETLQSITDRGNTTTNNIRSGYLDLQSYNVNNAFLANNLYYDGSGFRRRSTGYGSAAYFLDGGFAIRTSGYNTADTYTDLSEVLTIKNDGNVGIGTTSPAYKLDVNGSGNFMGLLTGYGGLKTGNGNAEGLTMLHGSAYLSGYNSDGSVRTGYLQFNAGSDVRLAAEGPNVGATIYTNAQPRVVVQSNGNVAIGATTAGDYKLAVEGTIGARKIKVTQAAWADYVFDSSYQLAPLHQLEKYIQENKHLPEIPSAAEVKKEGIDVMDNQVLLLKKIEELTLYIIQQNKDMQDQRKEIQEMKKVLKELKASQ